MIAVKKTDFIETRPQKQFQEKLQAKMEENGLDALILTNSESITYATGWVPNVSTTRQVGNALAVVPKTGKAAAICSQFEAGAPVQQCKEVEVIPYPCWIFIEDFYDPNEKEKPVQPDPFVPFKMADDYIRSKVSENKPKIGVEMGTMPVAIWDYMKSIYGEDNLVDIDQFMIEVKTIKLPWEIDVIRYAAQVSEKMFEITMLMTEPGMTEADIIRIWNNTAYDLTGGHDVSKVTQYHTPGADFWSTTLPREDVLTDTDTVRLDGGVFIYGYMSDLARTYAVGKTVDPEREAIFETLLAGNDAAVEQLYPGNKMCNVYKAADDAIHAGALPQIVRGHYGHTLGLGPTEEYPMLGKTNEMVLEPGMVFCVETPYYGSKLGSYNIEDEFVITEDGYERFTHTNRSMFPALK